MIFCIYCNEKRLNCVSKMRNATVVSSTNKFVGNFHTYLFCCHDSIVKNEFIYVAFNNYLVD